MFPAQNKIPYPFCDLSDSRFVSSHSKERNTFQLQCSYYKVESSPIWERDESLGETENVVQDPISLLPVSGDLTEKEVGGKRGERLEGRKRKDREQERGNTRGGKKYTVLVLVLSHFLRSIQVRAIHKLE